MLLIRPLIIALVLGSCVARKAESPNGDLQEAALRWAFANAETDLEDPAVYCVAYSRAPVTNGADPDSTFLERFRRDSIRVAPASACQFERDPGHNVVDRASGSFGLLFTVSPVEWESPERGVVPIGFMQGGLWGAGWECIVEMSGSAWVVSRCDRVLDV